MELWFCEDCGLRVSEADLAKGAVRDAEAFKVYCKACVAKKAPPPVADVASARKPGGAAKSTSQRMTAVLPADKASGSNSRMTAATRPTTQSARTLAPATRPKSDPHAATRPGASARAPQPLPTGTIIAGAVGVGVLVGAVTLMLLSGSPKTPDKPADKIAHNEEPRTTAAPVNPPPPAQTQQRVPTPAPSINTPAPPVENDETRAITAFETLKKRVKGELKDNKDVQVAAIDEYLAKYGETIAATRARVLRGEILNPRPTQSPEANTTQTLTDAQKIDVVNRANEMMRNGDSAGALAEYDKAIKIVPDSGVFFVNRADIKRAAGDFDEALSDLDKAEKYGFPEWQLPLQRALIFYAIHKENEARAALIKSRSIADAAKMDLFFNNEAPRARALYDGKQLEGKSISTAQEYVSRGTYRILIKKNTEGAADLEQAVKLDVSTAPSVFMTLANLAQGKKDWKTRLDAFHRWADAQPESPDALNSYAWELLTSEDTSLRDFKAAIPLAEKANKVAGEKNWGILDTLALAYFRNGRAQEAVNLEKKAIELMPGNTAASVRKEYDDHLAEFEAGLKAVK